MVRMMELPSWAGAALDVFYAFVVPGLIAYTIFGVALLVSPVVFAFWGKRLLSTGFGPVSASA